jgi:hypothetical protein
MESSTEPENPHDESYRSSSAASFESVDELNEFAQSYFANDFPNPGRPDCPTAETLIPLIRSSKLPDGELRAHLFGCSQCFSEYQNALVAYRKETGAEAARPKAWWNRLSAALPRTPLPIFASAFSLLLLMLAGVYIWRAHNSAPDSAPVSRQQSAPVVDPTQDSGKHSNGVQTPPPSPMPAPSVEQPTSGQSPKSVSPQKLPVRPSRTGEQRQGELLAQAVPKTLKVDLGDYAVTRGGSSTNPLKLPRLRTRLLLTLPEGSRAGLYTVSIVGSSENQLTFAKGQSADGKTLAVILNMQDLASQRYRLRVAHAGEPPDDYSVFISDDQLPSPAKKH